MVVEYTYDLINITIIRRVLLTFDDGRIAIT